MPRPKALTLPNMITAIRVVLLPFVVFFLMCGMEAWGADFCPTLVGAVGLAIAYIACGFGELTDVTDGFIARSRGETSNLGKLFDPLADSLSRFVVFLALYSQGYAAFWMVLVFYLRDITVSYYRSFAAAEGCVISARKSGKIKAMFQSAATMGSIMVMIFGHSAQIQSDPFARNVMIGAFIAGALIFIVYCACFRVSGWLLKLLCVLAVIAASPLLIVAFLPVGSFNAKFVVNCLIGIAALYTLWSLIDYTIGFMQAMGWMGAAKEKN